MIIGILLLLMLSVLRLASPDFSVPFGDSGWTKTYGGTDDDWANSIIETSDGGYALAGATCSYAPPNGLADCYLVKTDGSGNVQWNRTYGGIYDDGIDSVVQTSDGGYALAGYTASSTDDGYFVKTNSLGNMQWSKAYRGRGDEFLYSVIQTSDGGYALAGQTDSYGGGLFDEAYLIKTDSSGNTQWSKTYGGTWDDVASSVVQTSDGGYALAGASHLVKTDGSGNMQWSKTYGGTDYVDVRSVVQTSDGGYALAGSTICFGVDSSDAWLVKTDGSGNAQWRKTYGGTQDDFVNCGIQTSDSGYALAGRTVSFGAGDEDFYFVKTDSNLSPIHDVVVTNVYPSKTVVGEPSICMLNVTVVNRGDFIESFNITAWATIAPLITSIQNVSILNLSPDETRTVTILWNNTGWAYGNYAVSAYAEPVPGETDIADNIFADGTVIVTIPGDVDGDSNVGILDVVKITSCYGKKLGDTLYNPNADIDGNGVINILDVAICTGHYGQK